MELNHANKRLYKMEKSIRLIIESKISHISLLAKAVQAVCSEEVKDEITLYNIQLCLVEAVTNVIKHAYHLKPGNFVEVIVGLDEQQVMIQIIDNGEKATPPPVKELDKHQDLSNLAESGRGLFLIDQIMDEVIWSDSEGKNILTLKKSLENSQ